MTIHSAKGLEFGRVFLVGAEENLFPSFRSMADPMDIEEERRLAYVAITRAKNLLHITTARERLLFGMTQRNPVSRFIREIPDEHIQVNEKRHRKTAAAAIPPKNTLNSPFANRQTTGSATRTPRPAPPVNLVKYAAGERVVHKVFGEGTIVDVAEMGGDSLLEIAFDGVGTKKIMAAFAKIEKK
jgi:DNA helicase-2/ATP-dependent DNA helicase PcrA